MEKKLESVSKKLASYDDHLETFSLLWIKDEVSKTEKSHNNEQKLRTIINHLKIFDSTDECHQYIQSRSKEDRFLLIINDRFDRELISTIHDNYQVSSIYIYCSNENKIKQWSKGFSKVRHCLEYIYSSNRIIILD